MRTSLAIPTELKKRIEAALPLAKVAGLTGDEAAQLRLDAGGYVIVRSGDPGEPEIDLSPLTYNYAQRISVEVAAMTESALDDMLTAIGDVIVADRTLGGRCEWLDAVAPETEDLPVETGRPPAGSSIIVTASYSTTRPLT